MKIPHPTAEYHGRCRKWGALPCGPVRCCMQHKSGVTGVIASFMKHVRGILDMRLSSGGDK